MCELHGLLHNKITLLYFAYCSENFVLPCCTNVSALFIISKCFSVLTTLLASSKPLTRVEGDALVFNQVEGAFGLDFYIYSFLF
jgi:hypothetical protein